VYILLRTGMQKTPIPSAPLFVPQTSTQSAPLSNLQNNLNAAIHQSHTPHMHDRFLCSQQQHHGPHYVPNPPCKHPTLSTHARYRCSFASAVVKIKDKENHYSYAISTTYLFQRQPHHGTYDEATEPAARAGRVTGVARGKDWEE